MNANVYHEAKFFQLPNELLSKSKNSKPLKPYSLALTEQWDVINNVGNFIFMLKYNNMSARSVLGVTHSAVR